jgi:hypothetical protein
MPRRAGLCRLERHLRVASPLGSPRPSSSFLPGRSVAPVRASHGRSARALGLPPGPRSTLLFVIQVYVRSYYGGVVVLRADTASLKRGEERCEIKGVTHAPAFRGHSTAYERLTPTEAVLHRCWRLVASGGFTGSLEHRAGAPSWASDAYWCFIRRETVFPHF